MVGRPVLLSLSAFHYGVPTESEGVVGVIHSRNAFASQVRIHTCSLITSVLLLPRRRLKVKPSRASSIGVEGERSDFGTLAVMAKSRSEGIHRRSRVCGVRVEGLYETVRWWRLARIDFRYPATLSFGRVGTRSEGAMIMTSAPRVKTIGRLNIRSVMEIQWPKQEGAK